MTFLKGCWSELDLGTGITSAAHGCGTLTTALTNQSVDDRSGKETRINEVEYSGFSYRSMSHGIPAFTFYRPTTFQKEQENAPVEYVIPSTDSLQLSRSLRCDVNHKRTNIL